MSAILQRCSMVIMPPFLSAASSIAADYYVSTSGSDTTGTGSMSAPFIIPGNGSAAIDAGVVIPGITDSAVGMPDIGAFERGRDPWTAGIPAGGTAAVIKTGRTDRLKNRMRPENAGGPGLTQRVFDIRGRLISGNTISGVCRAGEEVRVVFAGCGLKKKSVQNE